MTTPDIIDTLDTLKGHIDRLSTDEQFAKHFALVHCVRALRRCMDADGLSPHTRQQARSAYRMAAAAAGMNHE